MDHYASLDSVSVYTEPVDKWRNLDGHNLLQLMYENPERHSYTFQSYVQLTMAQVHAEKTPKPIKIMERSLWSARHVFAENLHRSGMMATSELEVLNAWYEFLTGPDSNLDFGVDLIIYLRTSPEVAYQRLKARARAEEQIVSIDYLKELHQLHENWLGGDASTRGGGRILVVDADKDLDDTPHVYSEHQEAIFNAYKKTQKTLKPSLTLTKSSPLKDVSNCTLNKANKI